MRILFMGTPDFALFSLRALVESGKELVGVVTQPDKPKGRGYTLTPPPVKVYALEQNIPVYQPTTLRGEEFAETPAPVGGAWCRLGERGAKILLVGVGLNRHTFIHAVDEIAALDDRLSEKVWEVTVIDAEGRRITHPYRGHGGTGSEFFGKFEEMLTVGGAIGQGRLGDAEVKVVDARLCRDILLRFYARTTKNYCLMEGPIPRELWEDLV